MKNSQNWTIFSFPKDNFIVLYNLLGKFNMEDVKFNYKEFNDDYLLSGLDANGRVLELATSYCESLKQFRPLSKEEEMRLFHEYNENHSQDIKNEILTRHLRFVPWFINNRKINIEGMDFMDLVQEGNYILLKCFDSFDINLGVKFISFFGDSLERHFKNRKLETTHFMKIGHNMHNLYLKYVKYRDQYIEEKGCEPSKEEVMKKFHISLKTYKAYKNMDITGSNAISLDSPIVVDDKKASLYEFISSEENLIRDYEEYIDNKIVFYLVKSNLTPLEYYLFYNYTVDPKMFSQEKLGASLGISQAKISRILKKVTDKIHAMNLKREENDNILKRIEEIDVRPINFPKKVILIYMKDKLTLEEFVYAYNVWYMNYDEDTLVNKFNKWGMNYKKISESMMSIINNLNDALNNHYDSILKNVLQSFSVAQVFEKDITVDMINDYDVSKCLNSLTYEGVLDILGSNYDTLEENTKNTLYSYYKWKHIWRNVNLKEDIEAKINLRRWGFKRKRNISVDRLYKVYLENTGMFEDNVRELLEGTLFKQYTHKKGRIKDNSSAYYRSIWRLEEKYYNIDNYFNRDIPKKDYFYILDNYDYIFTKEELQILDMHSEFREDRMTFEEVANKLGMEATEVQATYLWAKNKILSIYLGIYRVKIIDNEPLYIEYINDPKFDITPLAREIGRLRFIEHLDYEEIAKRVNLSDDEDSKEKKSKTLATQKVSNIVNKLIRMIEMHHYNVLNETYIDPEKVIDLLETIKRVSDEEKEIIKDYYVEKLTMEEMKNKYGKTQVEINNLVMKFKRNYIKRYKINQGLEDIERELNEHVTDTVLNKDQRVVLAYLKGIKCPDNPEGKEVSALLVAHKLNTNEKNIQAIYSNALINIGAKKAGIIGADLGALSRRDVIDALSDENLPISDEEKILIKEFKGIDTETLSLDELGSKYKVNATSIKRRIQNIYLSILKYQDGLKEKNYDFDMDILPYLKYIPLFYQKILISIYKDKLSNKELALKYDIGYDRIHQVIKEAKIQLFYLMKCPCASRFDFDYARKVIDNEDIPYYDDNKLDVRYIFNRLFGNDGLEPLSKKELQERLGLSSNIKLNVILRKMMVAILKYKDGFKKEKSYTKEEIEEFYQKYQESLTDTCKYFFKRTLRDEADVSKGVNDLVLYELLKRETDKLVILDNLSKEEIRTLIKSNPYHLTKTQLDYLAFCYNIPSRELLSGKQKHKLYRSLAPYIKEYMKKQGQKLEKKNNL